MNYLQLTSLCIAFLLAAPSAFVSGQITQINQITRNIIQYEKAEWDISLKATWTNPYNAAEIAVNMRLTSPSGKNLLLPCYFENRSMMEYFWNVGIFSDTMLNSCKENFESFIVTVDNDDFHTLGVRCTSHHVVYIYNNSPQAQDIHVASDDMPAGTEIKTYDCETGKFQTRKISLSGKNNLRLEGFQLPATAGIVLLW